MEKRKIRQYISTAVIIFIIILLLVLPFLMEAVDKTEEFKPSILHADVTVGSIAETLSGGGAIKEQEPIKVSVPEGVEITEYYVSDGDLVPEGTPLASVRRSSVMKTISTLQKTLDHLSQEIQDHNYHQARDLLTSPSPGRVKTIYARQGESVREVMERDGCLAVVSLDGYMGVFIETDNMRTGEHLRVILPNGTELEGRVESATRDGITVLITDRDTNAGDIVNVYTKDGTHIGSGSLYIHNEWRCTGYTGTVNNIYVSPEELVWSGSWIIGLKDTEENSAFTVLAQQRAEYEDMMFRLFKLYQEGNILAECNGLVSGVDDSMLKLSSSEKYSPVLLANAPGDDPDAVYMNRLGVVLTKTGDSSIAVLMQSFDTVVEDYTDLSAVNLDPKSFTFAQTFPAPPVYAWDGARWTMGSDPVCGGVYLFAYSQELVWMIPVCIPDCPFDINDPSIWDTLIPDFSEIIKRLDINKIIASMLPSFSFGFGNTEQFDMFPLEEQKVMNLIPQNTVSIPVSIDELDVLNVNVGQSAIVTLDALPGQTFTGTVTDINLNGNNQGGNSKYTVTVELEKIPEMLPGMNASILIVIDEHDNIPLIPVEALYENKGSTYVYTSYNEQSEELKNPVDVATGHSDGIYVEIVEGLSKGDTVWYSYLDTLPISEAFES